jgi:uncharacterized protein (TIGR00251 family)
VGAPLGRAREREELTVGRIAVRVQARAKRDEIAGARAGALLVRVTAPPVEGRANAAVCKLIAKRLGLPPSRVWVVHGGSRRDKLVEVEGMTATALAAELGLPG